MQVTETGPDAHPATPKGSLEIWREDKMQLPPLQLPNAEKQSMKLPCLEPRLDQHSPPKFHCPSEDNSPTTQDGPEQEERPAPHNIHIDMEYQQHQHQHQHHKQQQQQQQQQQEQQQQQQEREPPNQPGSSSPPSPTGTASLSATPPPPSPKMIFTLTRSRSHTSTSYPTRSRARPHLPPSPNLPLHHSPPPSPLIPCPLTPLTKTIHTNKPYTLEELSFTRYFRDQNISYSAICQLFKKHFGIPPEDGFRGTDQAYSSRLYRDNEIPELDAEGEILRFDREGRRVGRGEGGEPRFLRVGVRGRKSGEGRVAPWKFVERDCELAVVYSWVEKKDKKRAMDLLRGCERGTRRDHYRRAIRRLRAEKGIEISQWAVQEFDT